MWKTASSIKLSTMMELIQDTLDEIKLYYLQQIDEDFEKRLSTVKILCTRIFDNLSENIDNNLTELHCIVFDEIHDFLISDMREFYSKQDVYLFNKFKYLCDLNVSVEQLGGDPNYSIPLLSAIVELSMLDSYKSPIEKMNCLLTTYDLIYADLKSAMILMISTNSDKDLEVPVINSNDVIPLMMLVVIKSKLSHFHTNLVFIEDFYYKLNENLNHLMVLNTFKITEDNLRRFNETLLKQKNQHMDMNEFFKLSTNQDQFDKTLTDQEKQRIVDLITLSTSDDGVED